MRSTVEPVEPTKVKINVVVEPDELGPAIDRAVRRLSREVKVPGFRKGKVPRPVLEARIGRETLIAEAIEHEAVPEFYAKAVEEHGVEPLARAKVDPPDYKDGQPLEFSATVEVKPEIDLPPYRGVEVERPELEVTDEHVDAQLDQLRERFAQLEVIGRPIAKGDFAQIDLRASRHATEIPELTRTDFLYEVGSGTVVPQLDEQLEGARKGDILRFNASLPEAAGEELAGQEVTFTMLVKEAKTKVLPSLDDDFAQEASEFDTLDELQYRAKRFAQQLSLMGLPLERYLEGVETTEEQLEADLRAQAERAVKAQLVLEAVANAEGMQASEEEVSAEIRRQAERLGRDPEDVRKALGGGRDSAIRGDILRSRALALLVENADVGAPRGGGEGEAEAVGATAGPDGDEQAPKE